MNTLADRNLVSIPALRLSQMRSPIWTKPSGPHEAAPGRHYLHLSFAEKVYWWKSPQADLAVGEKLIHDCGYPRHDPGLADAKQDEFLANGEIRLRRFPPVNLLGEAE